MSIKIALAGNPNSGKTTLFNALTGSSARVGNWPGVTVEKKEGKIKSHKDVILQDLPGIYSLSPYTLEEVVSRNYLINDKPDVLINIVDATNLERNLYLTTQLMEIGIPVVVALNMIDLVRKNGDSLNLDRLSKELGCSVIETSALKGIGTKEIVEQAVSLAKEAKKPLPSMVTFSASVERTLSVIEKEISSLVDAKMLRWYSIKLFERDEKILAELKLSSSAKKVIDSAIGACEGMEDDDSESIITNERYNYISEVAMSGSKKHISAKMNTSDKIDRIVTNRILGLPIFAVIMFLVYFISISTIGSMATDWVNDSFFGEIVPGAVDTFLGFVGANEVVSSLVQDGIVAGVGAVIGFLPQMLILFICLAILEECGYMSRVAFVMDRIFRRFGLSGKSFIPIMIGTGCGVPGVMAARTIENESDRKITIMTTTFIPCGAKLPIIALFAGAIFDGSGLVALSAYFIGIAAIICTGVIFKKLKSFAGDPAPFVMELPKYHAPSVKGVARYTAEKGRSFVKRAGTIILLSSIVIWFLQSFDTSLQMVDTDESILANIGNFIAPIFAPLGWEDWRAAVSTITGLIAKENVVGTMGVLYGGIGEVAENGNEIWGLVSASFTALSAYSFLIFNMLCAPCFAAIGAIHHEMGTAKWTLITVAYQTVLAYVVSMIVYNLGMLIAYGIFGAATVVSIILLIAFIYLLLRRNKYTGSGVRLQAEKVGV